MFSPLFFIPEQESLCCYIDVFNQDDVYFPQGAFRTELRGAKHSTEIASL